MGELQVIGALCDKRSELAGLVKDLEQQLAEHCAALTHLDATIRLFDPQIQPDEIRPRQRRRCNAWFRPGECLRLIYNVLRDAPEPVITREIVEQIAALKSIPLGDERRRALFQKTLLASLNRAKDTLVRVESGGEVRWQVR